MPQARSRCRPSPSSGLEPAGFGDSMAIGSMMAMRTGDEGVNADSTTPIASQLRAIEAQFGGKIRSTRYATRFRARSSGARKPK